MDLGRASIRFLHDERHRKLLILLTFSSWVALFLLSVLWKPFIKQQGSLTLLISVRPIPSFSGEEKRWLPLQLKMTATFHRRLLENPALLEAAWQELKQADPKISMPRPLTVKMEKTSNQSFLFHLFLKHEKPVAFLYTLMGLYLEDYFNTGIEEAKKNLSKIYEGLNALERTIIAQEMALFEKGDSQEKVYRVENLSHYFSSLNEIKKKKGEALQNEELARRLDAGESLSGGITRELQEYKRARDEFMALSKKYKSAHPLLEKSRQQLSQIKNSFRTRVLNLEREEKELMEKLSDARKRFAISGSALGSSSQSLRKSLEINKKIYAQMREKTEKILGEGLIQSTDIQILTPPHLLSPPFFPLGSFITGSIAALLVFFTLMIGALYLIERYQRKQATAKQVVSLHLKTLGNFRLSSFKGKMGDEIHLLLYQHPDHPFANDVRRLTNQFITNTRGKEVKSLLVTYERVNPKKISITTNLGVSLVHQNKKALLIDAFWSAPHLDSLFSLKNDPGLVDILLGRTQWQNVIQETEIPGLEILPSGQYLPYTFELLSSPFMETLLDQLEPVYDFIFIEAPSVFDHYDIYALAQYVQGIILVQNENKKIKPMIRFQNNLSPEDFEKLAWVGKVGVIA